MTSALQADEAKRFLRIEVGNSSQDLGEVELSGKNIAVDQAGDRSTLQRELVEKSGVSNNDEEEDELWTVYSSKVSLPAVLSDPSRWRPEADFFTKSWGEGFLPLSRLPRHYLPVIKKSEFAHYIKQLGKPYKSHVRTTRIAAAVREEPIGYVQSHSVLSDSHDSTLSFSKGADSRERRVNEVPRVFLRPDFDLENPVTFREALPLQHLYDSKQDLITKAGRRKSGSNSKFNTSDPMQTSRLLHETLTQYLDRVEVQLAQQIALKSDDFFRTISSQDTLADELIVFRRDVTCLRENLLSACVPLYQGPLQTLHLKKRQLRLIAVYHKDKLTSVVFGLLKLRNVHFLDAFRDEVFTAIKGCIKQTVRRLVGIESEQDDLSSSSVAEHMRRQSFHEWFGMLQTVFHSVLVILQKLLVIHKLIISVVDLYQAQNGDAKIEEGDSLPGKVKVDVADVMVSVEVLDPLPEVMEGPKCASKFVNNVNEFGVLKYSDIKAESNELLRSACELVHLRCAKLIAVKAKDGSLERLVASDFVRFVQALERFIRECQAVCGRQSHSLRATILTQAKVYLEKFHEEKKTKLVLLLDGERWNCIDEVPVQIQEIVAALEDGGTDEVCSVQSGQSSFVPDNAKNKLQLKAGNFVVSGAVLLLLRIAYEYCRTGDDIPMLLTDIMARLVEVFQIFNKRTWQLVLGAGALQTVGLKSITAKHLALSSQCMSAVAALIPSVKAYFESRLLVRERVLLGQFNVLTEDYKNHVREIHAKLLSMIEDVIVKQLSKWDCKSTAPSASFRNIVKQIVKLYDVLNLLLSVEQLKNLFQDVQKVFHTTLRQRMTKLDINQSCGEVTRLLQVELKFFVDSLRDLSGLEGIQIYVDYGIWTNT
ncbi:vacuolar protein sorting-associated protein 54-like isoform X2 [Corticium candelabrum]|uniref:vacuolar protein sorting-associated protein 54-like isoform X2 n=1 Tax=Corticium candelabrum TaxID=121492 RepID=UPI002E25F952|nr:vacuolar protein sorting-associated protein 54-like isoform X2 [Corticium candelabrum]